jgi:hypothetical protein
MKPIEMICTFDEEGNVRPYRFRLMENDEKITIQIKSIMDKKEERVLGKKSITFTCLCPMYDKKMIYIVKFDLDSCKWYLVGNGIMG